LIQIICDRCGTLITDEIQKNLQYFIPVETDQGKDGVNLCPDCKKSFTVWWKDLPHCSICGGAHAEGAH